MRRFARGRAAGRKPTQDCAFQFREKWRVQEESGLGLFLSAVRTLTQSSQEYWRRSALAVG